MKEVIKFHDKETNIAKTFFFFLTHIIYLTSARRGSERSAYIKKIDIFVETH